MIKGIAYYLLIAFWGIVFDGGKSRSGNLKVAIELPCAVENDTVAIDSRKSRIYWKGTKMMGLGSHGGEIEILKGFLIFQQDELTGGEITVDMKTISVTDIPKSDPIPIRNLTNHLQSPDFFYVDKYPISTLKIRSVQRLVDNRLLVNGLLTIKGISNPVSFEVENVGKSHFQTSLVIDRFDWDIAYSGSWVDRTLVDRDIAIRGELVCK